MTSAPADQSVVKAAPSPDVHRIVVASHDVHRIVVASPNLHRIVVVRGGAGGLELATRLGDRLGRRRRADIALVEKARTHLWKPLLHESRRRQHGRCPHELDYLAQAHWHGFASGLAR